MAKKQTIILSHGSQRPSEELIKSLKLGEVLVQHAEKAEDAALHTIIGTSGESAQLVSFPSKEYVDSVATSNSAVTALDTRLDAAEGKIDTISGATETNKTNIAKNAEDIAKNAEVIAKNAEDILTKADKSVVEGIDTRLVAAEQTITAHTESISANATAIANAQTAITANATAIKNNADAILTKADKSVVEGIDTRLVAAEQTITAHTESISANTTAITANANAIAKNVEDIAKKADATALTETNEAVEAVDARVDKLVGDVEGDGDKSVRNIAAEEVAKVVANAPESFDTLKEIADWIQNDETGAADMANDIAELQKIVSGYTTGSTIKSTVDALTERVADVESGITEINKTIEDNELVTSNALNDLDVRVKANLAKIDGEIERAQGAEDALDKAIDALDAAAIKEIVANDAAGNSIVSKEGNKVTLDFSSFVIDGGEY